MEKVAIVSIIYKEPEWAETERCLDKCNVPIFFVDRHGVGSLAKAINSGLRQWGKGFEYIWFVTNVTFKETCLSSLLKAIEEYGLAGLTPCFSSDHSFCQPMAGITGVNPNVPFIEFTAPIIRTKVLEDYPLDENMPYWGHDLDWGYRVRAAGWKIGVLYDEELGHVYIRNSGLTHHITVRRMEKRKATNAKTRAALVGKYGGQWRKKLQWD